MLRDEALQALSNVNEFEYAKSSSSIREALQSILNEKSSIANSLIVATVDGENDLELNSTREKVQKLSEKNDLVIISVGNSSESSKRRINKKYKMKNVEIINLENYKDMVDNISFLQKRLS